MMIKMMTMMVMMIHDQKRSRRSAKNWSFSAEDFPLAISEAEGRASREEPRICWLSHMMKKPLHP
jgi:hypothetical protein